MYLLQLKELHNKLTSYGNKMFWRITYRDKLCYASTHLYNGFFLFSRSSSISSLNSLFEYRSRSPQCTSRTRYDLIQLFNLNCCYILLYVLLIFPLVYYLFLDLSPHLQWELLAFLAIRERLHQVHQFLKRIAG